MIQSMLTKESPEIIRFFRILRACPKYWTHRRKRCGPVLNGERYMTDSELAEHLKLTRRTLAEYRITGKLPYYKVGGKLLYKEKDILVLLERNRMEAFDYR
ncbi:helix-turn-helix domain-containing protein [Bacteroides xylanisolvens]|nr:helix-turn-helix domain-containing protein [Bacteroides xylanisolvens]